MTNNDTIIEERLRLIGSGIPTNKVKSYKHWNKSGYHIIKGQKALFSAEIWEVDDDGNFKMVLNYFFSEDQVRRNRRGHTKQFLEDREANRQIAKMWR